jgi:hypothetical protein
MCQIQAHATLRFLRFLRFGSKKPASIPIETSLLLKSTLFQTQKNQLI